MPTLRENLKDHPVQSILTALASITTILGFFFALKLNGCENKSVEQAKTVTSDTLTEPTNKKNKSIPEVLEASPSSNSVTNQNTIKSAQSLQANELPTEPQYFITNASERHKVYFHNSPDVTTRRNAYMTSQEKVLVQKIVNGFGYIEFVNDRGQKSFGWLLVKDLIACP